MYKTVITDTVIRHRALRVYDRDKVDQRSQGRFLKWYLSSEDWSRIN